MDKSISQRSEEALQYLKGRIPSELDQPAVGIICGSGLGGLAKSVLPQPRLEVPYKDIPHFPQSKGSFDPKDSQCCCSSGLTVGLVQGHAGMLLFGLLESVDTPVVLMVGRAQSVTASLDSSS